MSRKIVIVFMCLAVMVSTVWYTVYQFQQIELEMVPYMTKCAQMQTLFLGNRQLFEKMVKNLGKYEQLYYQYNCSFGRPVVEEEWGEVDFIDDLMYLFETLHMNIVIKKENVISFRQVNPMPNNYIGIGVNLILESNKWIFIYFHSDNYRELNHKWIYRLYDFIYNRGVGEPILEEVGS